MKNLIRITIITLVLGVGIWTLAVTLSPIVSSFSAGDEVSAATFNDLFTAINDNFVALNGGKVENTGDTITGDLGVDGDLVLNSTAISSEEIENEPGVAGNLGVVNCCNTLDSGFQTLISRTITVPTAGQVMAIATAQVQASHTNGTSSNASFGVNDTASTLPGTQDIGVFIHGGAPSGLYAMGVTPHGLFTVAAGTHTFFLIANEESGAFLAGDLNLTLLFFPTSYGTVSSNVMATAAEPDRARSTTVHFDGAAEQAQSVADNQARIQRELAEMRQRMESLQDQLDRMQ